MVIGNYPGNQKLCAIAHKMGIKLGKCEIWRHPCNHVLVVTIAGDLELKTVSYGPQKWRQKHEKYVSVVTVIGNHPGNQKCAL
jgi:hypothetical protein